MRFIPGIFFLLPTNCIPRERAYRETGWDSEWGPQNDGHLTWITKLKDLWVKLDEKSDEIEHQLVE